METALVQHLWTLKSCKFCIAAEIVAIALANEKLN